MTSAVWSWADVPKHTPAPEPRPRRAQGSGRPPHPVTLGHHDEAIVLMAQRGDAAAYIANRVGCSSGLIARRLRVLGVEIWR